MLTSSAVLRLARGCAVAAVGARAAGNVARVRVAVPAWSEEDNSIVAGLFVGGEPEPRVLASQKLGARQAAAATVALEIVAGDTQPIEFSVRVGPGETGIVYLNSDKVSAIPDLSKPTLTIEEYASFWRRSSTR